MLVQLRSADVACEEATLRTHPLSGQAAINSLLGRTKPIACHSGAAFEGWVEINFSQQCKLGDA